MSYGLSFLSSSLPMTLDYPQHPSIYFTELVETKEIRGLMSNIWSVELNRNSVDIVMRGEV